MNIHTLASGSSGNCYRISDGHTPLLIECGIRFSEIRKGCGFKLSEIAGCLITHEHGDHSKSAREIMRAGIELYASAGTIEALELQGHRLHVICAKKRFSIGTWTILPFETEHDAVEPLGFLLASTAGEKLLYLTDSFYCRYKFAGLTHVMVECNYHLPILQENIEAGIVSPAQMSRIFRSHFSLDNLLAFLCNSDLSRVREIHLLHLSNDNSDPALFRSEVEKATGKPVYIAG